MVVRRHVAGAEPVSGRQTLTAVSGLVVSERYGAVPSSEEVNLGGRLAES